MSSNQNDKIPGPLADANGNEKSMTNGAGQAGVATGIGGGINGAAKAKAPQALDRWFDDQLNQLFNDVSSEPLPPDLAKLIGQLKAQSQK